MRCLPFINGKDVSKKRNEANQSVIHEHLPSYAAATSEKEPTNGPAKWIEKEIESHSSSLRQTSLDMWGKPEVAWKEHHTHDLLVGYLLKQSGWKVTPHAHGVKTAFRAEFQHESSDSHGQIPVIGFQSEMDALPGIGHACGHNLIAISGIAASLGLARAAKELDFSVRIVLIGTPAEEASGGKRLLLKRGAYKDMDVCL